MLQLRFFSMFTLVSLLSALCCAQSESISTASGETEGVGSKSAEKKQSINFEDELIEGTAQKPDLFYLFQKNNFKFKKLIKLRENFLPEMSKNAEDIQRLRGGR